MMKKRVVMIALKRNVRRVGVVGVGALAVASAALVLAPSAQADTFTPVNLPSTPTVVITGSPTTAVQPAYPRSTSVYEVDATVTNADGFDKVSGIAMCWYLQGNASECDSPGGDPRLSFVMTYDTTLGFNVVGTNNYQNASSVATTTDSTSRDLAFKFKVSDVMTAGLWNVKAVASTLDLSLNPQIASDEDTGITVNYFGYYGQDRVAEDFGDILEGNTPDQTSGYKVGVVGTLIANGNSKLSLSSTDFTHKTNGVVDDTLGLSGNFPTESGKVRLGWGTNVYVPSSEISLSNVPQSLYSLFENGTVEAGETAPYDLSLAYGGGAAFPNTQYSATITVAIGKY